MLQYESNGDRINQDHQQCGKPRSIVVRAQTLRNALIANCRLMLSLSIVKTIACGTCCIAFLTVLIIAFMQN